MTFIYYKVIYFCSLNTRLDCHKVKMINARMLLLCTCRVTVLLLCSLFFTSRDCRLIYHTLYKLLEKERFYSILLSLEIALWLFIREDIPSKLISSNKFTEGLYVGLNLRNEKWILCCTCNPNRNDILNHFDIIEEA